MKKVNLAIFLMFFSFATQLAQAQIVGTSIFLQGAYVEIGSQRTAALGSGSAAPTGYHPHIGLTASTSAYLCSTSSNRILSSVADAGHTGWSTATGSHYYGDFTLPGTPWEMWCIMANGSTGFSYATNCTFTGSGSLTGSWSSYTSATAGGGTASGVWDGSFLSGNLRLSKLYEVDTFGHHLVVTVKMYNTTATDITNVYYFRSSDPDNDQSWGSGGAFTTNNHINYQGDAANRHEVTAYPYSGGGGYGRYGLATKDCRAKALIYNNWGGFSCTDLSAIYGGTASCLGGSYYDLRGLHSGDIAIALIFNIGTIPAYDSACLSYAYIYNDSVGIDSAFPNPQMVIGGVAYDILDTISCRTASAATVAVDLAHADSRNFTWTQWTWAPATGLSSTTGTHVDVDVSSLTAPITYTITGTDSISHNCNGKSFLLTVIPPPRIHVINNSPLCPGDNLIITLIDTLSSTSSTFSWTGPGGFTATTANVNINPCSFADSGVYHITVNDDGCYISDTTLVVVHSTPPSPIFSNPTYCQYLSSVPLSARGSNILWYTTATGGTGSAVAPTPSTTAAGTFTWWVTQTINGCESARYPVVVTINPKPVPPTITDTPGVYCAGEPWHTFSYPSSTGALLWYPGSTGGPGSATPPTVNTNVPGSYTFWASQSLLGCESDRSPITITVLDSVRAHFNGTVHLGCTSDTIVFDNYSYGASTYLWSFGDGNSSHDVNPTHVYTHQQIDTVILYAHNGHCQDSLIEYFDLTHPMNADFTLSPGLICQGSVDTFTNSSTGRRLSYQWSFGDGATDTARNPTHIYANTGTYNIMMILKDFLPCYDTAYGTVVVDSASPIIPTISDTAICVGSYLTLSADYSSIGFTNLVWSFGNGDSVYNHNPVSYAYSTPGDYTITAKVVYRVCPTATATKVVHVNTQPTVNIGPDTSICAGTEAVFYMRDATNAGNSAASWLWSTGETNSSIGVVNAGTYWVTVSIGGCTVSDTIVLTDDCDFNVGNCFTPDGDGVHDYFDPRRGVSSELSSFVMRIYNRWGEKVFETTATEGRGWDGKYGGTDQPEGVYIYNITAEFSSGRRITKSGNLTLMR